MSNTNQVGTIEISIIRLLNLASTLFEGGDNPPYIAMHRDLDTPQPVLFIDHKDETYYVLLNERTLANPAKVLSELLLQIEKQTL